jgi:hypothetical protein
VVSKGLLNRSVLATEHVRLCVPAMLPMPPKGGERMLHGNGPHCTVTGRVVYPSGSTSMLRATASKTSFRRPYVPRVSTTTTAASAPAHSHHVSYVCCAPAAARSPAYFHRPTFREATGRSAHPSWTWQQHSSGVRACVPCCVLRCIHAGWNSTCLRVCVRPPARPSVHKSIIHT